MIHSLKYLRSPTSQCKDIGIRKSVFVTKTQFLSRLFIFCTLQNFTDGFIVLEFGTTWAIMVTLTCRLIRKKQV